MAQRNVERLAEFMPVRCRRLCLAPGQPHSDLALQVWWWQASTVEALLLVQWHDV